MRSRTLNICLRTAVLLGTIILASCSRPENPAPKKHPPEVAILTRKEWGAVPPVLEMTPHTPKRITIHHTATRQKPDRALAEKMKSLQQFSQREDKLATGKLKPRWPDVPYHYYIDCKGKIAEGRDVMFVGDTNTEYVPIGHVLVVLEGNFEEEEPTKEQLAALHDLVAWLADHWNVPTTEIKGHQDYAETLCPGKNLESRLAELRASLPVN